MMRFPRSVVLEEGTKEGTLGPYLLLAQAKARPTDAGGEGIWLARG